MLRKEPGQKALGLRSLQLTARAAPLDVALKRIGFSPIWQFLKPLHQFGETLGGGEDFLLCGSVLLY